MCPAHQTTTLLEVTITRCGIFAGTSSLRDGTFAEPTKCDGHFDRCPSHIAGPAKRHHPTRPHPPTLFRPAYPLHGQRRAHAAPVPSPCRARALSSLLLQYMTHTPHRCRVCVICCGATPNPCSITCSMERGIVVYLHHPRPPPRGGLRPPCPLPLLHPSRTYTMCHAIFPPCDNRPSLSKIHPAYPRYDNEDYR